MIKNPLFFIIFLEFVFVTSAKSFFTFGSLPSVYMYVRGFSVLLLVDLLLIPSLVILSIATLNTFYISQTSSFYSFSVSSLLSFSYIYFVVFACSQCLCHSASLPDLLVCWLWRAVLADWRKKRKLIRERRACYQLALLFKLYLSVCIFF